MYGDRFGRGGRNIYRWTSRDGGQSWQGATVRAVAFQNNFAADVVIGFDEQGRDHLIAMFGDRHFPKDPVILYLLLKGASVAAGLLGRPVSGNEEEARGGGIALSVGDPQSGELGVPQRISSLPDRHADKTWLTIDNSPTSPHRGNVYAVWSESGTGGPTTIAMTTARVGGAINTTGVPVVVQYAGSYWPSVATRPTGRVDLVWFDTKNQVIQHRRSDDGGQSFTAIANITTERHGVKVDSPAVAVAPDGTVMACWTESTDSTALRTKCSTTRGDEGWSVAVDVDTTLSGRGMVGQPAIAAGATGFWVLAYRTDQRTDVVLYRSTDGGKTFAPYRLLGSRSFGVDQVCMGLAHDTPCRYDPLQRKFAGGGDYIGLSTAGNRVAAAFGLTLGNDPDQFATTYVKVLDVAAPE